MATASPSRQITHALSPVLMFILKLFSGKHSTPCRARTLMRTCLSRICDQHGAYVLCPRNTQDVPVPYYLSASTIAPTLPASAARCRRSFSLKALPSTSVRCVSCNSCKQASREASPLLLASYMCISSSILHHHHAKQQSAIGRMLLYCKHLLTGPTTCYPVASSTVVLKQPYSHCSSQQLPALNQGQ